MAPKKAPRKKAAVGAVRRRRPAARKTVRRRRRRSSVGFLKGNMGMLLGVALGGVAARLIDQPLSNIMPNDMLKNAAKAALGAFLGMRPAGIVQGMGLGIFASSAADLVGDLMPDTMAGIPALISGNVPALISDEFGNVYESDALAAYTSDMLTNSNAPQYMDMGYDAAEMGAMGL